MLRSIIHLQVIVCGLKVETYLLPNIYQIVQASLIERLCFPSEPFM